MAHETLRGKVYDLQIRYEMNVRGFAVSFRLAVAQNVPPIQVMMRGMLIEGSINDGDVVEVAGSRRNGILWARSVTNVATGATTTASYNPVTGLQRGNKASVPVYYAILIFLIPFLLFVFAFLVWGFIQAINNGMLH
jgi:hypothetical protein